MYYHFGVPAALTVIGLGFVALMFGLQKLLAPSNPYARKLMPYECGEPPTGRAWKIRSRLCIGATRFTSADPGPRDLSCCKPCACSKVST